METPVTRIMRRLLARVPGVYLAMLGFLHRGSAEKRVYLSIVKRGDTVIDVGANVGYFTMLFSDLVGKNGEVHAFEPVPATFQQLSQNIRRYPGYGNVQLNSVALGNEDHQTCMFLPGTDHGQAALVRHHSGSWKGAPLASSEVQMMTLDTYAQRFRRVDFVKCDVEGAELLVLRGGQSTLRRFQPKLCLEVDGQWMESFGWTAMDLFSFLRQLGYSHFYRVDAGLIPVEADGCAEGVILCTWEELRGLA